MMGDVLLRLYPLHVACYNSEYPSVLFERDEHYSAPKTGDDSCEYWHIRHL